jgi:hypothetical protein
MGTLTAALFDMLMHTEKWMDPIILLDSSQGTKVPKLPGNMKLLPLRYHVFIDRSTLSSPWVVAFFNNIKYKLLI